MLDCDLAKLYQVETGALNRNCGYNRPRRQKVHAICFYGARDINALCSAS